MSGKHALVVRTAVVASTLLIGLAPAAAARQPSDDGPPPTYHNIGTVTEPAIAAIKAGVTKTNPTGKFASFDISWVDPSRNLYYLADRSNNAVDVIDASDGSFVKFLGQGLFSGVVTGPPSRSGPDGVLTDRDGNVWVGDGLIGGVGHSSIKAFDAETGALIANIDNGGSARADEEAYGPVHGGRLLMANPNEPSTVSNGVITDPAFTTLVNTRTHSIIGKVLYDEAAHAGLPAAGHGFSTFFTDPGATAPTQHGLEQPAFAGGKFYLNVPATVQNPGGEIDVFDSNAAKITAVLPLTTCGGTGLAIGPRGDLAVECADSLRMLDTNGSEEIRVALFGGADEIWFNSGDGSVYVPLPASTALGRPASGVGVFDAVHNESLGITVVSGAQGLHSIAVNATNNRIFLPIGDNPDNGAGGIAMLHKASRGRDSDN
jgi:hypothetical protein